MFRIKRKRVTLINGDEVEMDLSSIEYELSTVRIFSSFIERNISL